MNFFLVGKSSFLVKADKKLEHKTQHIEQQNSPTRTSQTTCEILSTILNTKTLRDITQMVDQCKQSQSRFSFHNSHTHHRML